MTEKEIINLKFERFDEKADQKHIFHYYTLDPVKGLALISNSNDEAKEEGWCVELWDTVPAIIFTDIKELTQFINLIENNKIKEDGKENK